MADVTQTPADVELGGGGAVASRVTLGATLVQGDVVYKDTASANKMKAADADAGTELEATVEGIMLTSGADAGSGYVVTSGPMNVGGTLVQGTIYVLSGAAGKIAPAADLTTGDRVTILGVASSTSILEVKIQNTGIVF